MIVVESLEKRFGRLHVLNELNLRFETGRITAVVGPNGSGKSTLIKCILGLVRPDGGAIRFDDNVLGEDCTYRERIGYMPQQAHFPENLSAQEVIAMLKDFRGGNQTLDEDLFENFQLEKEKHKPLRTLSGGTRQKVSAVIAFLFNPDLVILDEPTAGLDPVASSVLKDKILADRAGGKTFILTSHIMSEIEELADYVAFLLDGRVRFEGDLEEIRKHTGHERLERALAHMMTEDNPQGKKSA